MHGYISLGPFLLQHYLGLRTQTTLRQTMSKFLTTLAVVGLFFAPRLQAQCTLYSGSYTAMEIKTCLGDSRTLTIPDFELVELDGSWNLTSLGPITFVIKGSGCLIFSGYNDNAEKLKLAQGSSIIIEEGNDNPFALLGTGIAGQKRIKIGDEWYRERDFSDVINGFGVSSLLPIELAYFRAKGEDQQVYLEWQTEVEINNAFFEIEHSQNGKDFKAIAYLEGAGTSVRAQKYQFQHKAPVQGINYYRLKQTDFDGAFSYSAIETVKHQTLSNPSVKVYPNPVSERFTITHNSEEEISEIKLYSVLGQQLVGRWMEAQTSYALPGNLAAGQYVLKVTAGAQQWMERIIIQ